MSEQVRIRTFTVSDLKQWLVNNQVVEGLSEKIIAPSRAYAILNNPFVRDNMQVVCALYVDNSPVAFTAAFPEVLEKPKSRLAWWFSTLWCDPKYEGRGYGLIVVGTLCECIGIENVFDVYGSGETVEIFRILGLSSTSFPCFSFINRRFLSSFRGRTLSLLFDAFHYRRVANILFGLEKSLHDGNWKTRFSGFIDEESYSFMLSHCEHDIFLRRIETYNWILKYPFVQSSLIIDESQRDNYFSTSVGLYQSVFVKIYLQTQLMAVSLLVFADGSVSFKYLYYDESFTRSVFSILLKYVIQMKAYRIHLSDSKFAAFIESFKFYSKSSVSSVSFSYPKGFDLVSESSLQGGDGDFFV